MLAMCAYVLTVTVRPSAVQVGGLRGVVVDSATGSAVENANVLVAEHHKVARTDSKGRFALDKMPNGDIHLVVRRVGYRPSEQTIVLSGGRGDSVTVQLVANPQVQRAIAADESERMLREGIEDFYVRRAKDLGYYVSRQELEGLQNPRTQWSEVVSNFPGVRVNYSRGGTVRFVEPRFTAGDNFDRECGPALWLDGQLAGTGSKVIPPARNLEGIELYVGRTTPRALWWKGQEPACGTIALWTHPSGGSAESEVNR